MGGAVTKVDDDARGRHVDVAHDAHLLGALGIVVLVDAERVGLDGRRRDARCAAVAEIAEGAGEAFRPATAIPLTVIMVVSAG